MGKTPPAADADRYIVPGLARGLHLLQCFTPERQRLSLGDMAGALGVTRSAMFRIAYTLADLGFLAHDAQSHTYALGPAVVRLGYGYLAARELVEVATPVLERLRDKTGWSAHLGALEGRDVLYLLRAPARRGAASIVHVGSRLPAHATSMGRVLLAWLPEDALAALYKTVKPAGVTARTATTLRALAAQAKTDRARGFVAQAGDFETAIASIAAPVRDLSGKAVAAINISAARTVLDGAAWHAALAPLVRDAAAEISAALGWDDQG